MRVLILSESTNIGEIGGGEIFNYHLLKALYNHNYQVLLFSDKRFKKNLLNKVILDNYKIYVFKSLMLSTNESIRFFSIFFSMFKIIKTTKKFKPDIIFTNIDIAIPVAYFIHTIFRIPIIFYKASIHIGNNLLALPSSPKIYALIEKIILRSLNFNLIISCSSHFSLIYKKLGGTSRCITLPVGCDLNKFKPITRRKIIKIRRNLGIDPGAKVIIYVGRLIHEKGVLDLLRAFKLLIEREKKFILLLVGGGNIMDQVTQYVKSNNLSSNIKIYGVVPHNTVPILMQVSDIFVLPSYNELYPRSVIEAMACGKPILGTTIPAFEELFNHESSFLVPPKNPEYLAENLYLILNNEKIMRKLGKKSLKIAKKHSYEIWSKKIMTSIISVT